MINLLPPAMKDGFVYGRRNVTAAQAVFIVALLSACLVAVLLFGVQIVSSDERNLREAIAQKESDLAELQPSVEEAKALKKTLDTISALLDREVKFSSLLQDIGSLIPNGAVLTGLALTGDSSEPLQIDAEVDTEAKAAVLRQNLESSKLFKTADIQTISAGDRTEDGAIINYRASLVVSFEDGGATE